MDLINYFNVTSLVIKARYTTNIPQITKVIKKNSTMLQIFCDCQAYITKSVIVKLGKQCDKIIREWVDKPHLAQQYIRQVKYQQKLIKQKQIKKQDLFKQIGNDILYCLGQYLCPLQLFNLFRCAKRYFFLWKDQGIFQRYLIYLSVIERQNHNLYGIVLDYILDNPDKYNLATRQQAVIDVRKIMWYKKQHNPVQIDWKRQIYSFKKQYTLLNKRVNFRGFYSYKQQYVRIGQKSIENPISQLIFNCYYRYLRFYPDGLVISKVCNRKLYGQKIDKNLSKNSVGVMHGQYCINDGYLYCKLIRGFQLYNMDFKIDSEMGIKLNLILHKLILIDNSQVKQTIYKSGKDVTPKIYRWVNYDFQQQINQKQLMCYLSTN